MILVLIATLVGGWRYEGFEADPAPPAPVVPKPVPTGPVVPRRPPTPAPAPVPAPPPDPPPASIKPGVERDGDGDDDLDIEEGNPTEPTSVAPPKIAPKPATVAKAMPPRTVNPKSRPRVVAPPRPTSWRLADASGQVWEHTDPNHLRRWVAYRNAMLTGSWYDASIGPPGGPCTSGRCDRHSR